MKYIHYFTNLRNEICPYCERRVIEREMGIMGKARLFTCLFPHSYKDDELKQLIDEPCNKDDYERCPLPKGKLDDK